MKLALEARDGWRTDPVFNPYYHETGMLYAESKGMSRDFFEKVSADRYQTRVENLARSGGSCQLGWCISRCLYLATGGSFHSWKFMPTIGQYIVKMLHGELNEEQSNRWAWDRTASGGSALPEYIPARDLQDIYR
ncbi:hypothetical protein EJ03DRAFT_336447 [Teratosphaeria nubilosa]|uniref:Uncharacterized protein n=1 Tax=Teratosphaeria nubilosa TaxID=161662 RepID=A0A6G1L891_9PEZI|nr:hypothetical protein EJ03DRAFT_336447 [Teratosphaeria nubilosa]